MSAIASSLGYPCLKCKISVFWTESNSYYTAEIIKAPNDKTPPLPNQSCNIYPPGGSYYLVDSPNWNTDIKQAFTIPEYINTSYSLPYNCIDMATNVRQIGPQSSKITEEFITSTAPVYNFYYQCSAPNPNPPPPEILTIIGPISKTYQRDIVREITTYTTLYRGEIECDCGFPAECGCRGGPPIR